MKKVIAMFLAIFMLMLITPATHAEELIEKYPYVEALNLEAGDFKWIFVAPDFEEMTYVGTRQIENEKCEQLEIELASIGPVKYLKPGGEVLGDMIIRTTVNMRYSYYLESANVLNINGQRYQLSTEQMQHIKNMIQIIEENEYASRYPLWFAWMNPFNVKSITQFQPLVADQDFRPAAYVFENQSSFSAEINFIAYMLLRDYFDIEKGERYEMGSVELPKDQEYYEMTIGLSSGTSYKVMTHGSTMLLEASDMAYGCKYTLKSKKKQTSIRAAYSHWTYRWAHPPDM